MWVGTIKASRSLKDEQTTQSISGRLYTLAYRVQMQAAYMQDWCQHSNTADPDLNDTFLQLTKATRVILVESQDDLLTSSSLVESAYVCGIDAEWEPGLPTATATLLQLAFTTDSPHQPGSFVLLLDLLSLPQSAVKDFLQGLLRNAKILKLGYGLVHDLWAIAAALGDEGLGCVAVVEPQLDVGTLHRQLHKAHVPGIAKVVGKGLSALTQAQLSMPLDKSLQCSTWGLRPLTRPQTKGKGSRHLVYRQMVDVAQAEERVILTCDRTFIRMGYSDQAFYVRTTNKQEQVKEVLTHFDITVNEDSLLSRCAKCNGTFYPRPIPAGELPSNASEVADHIKELHREFWCADEHSRIMYVV
ncbi:hypothetical protein WJX79_001761 [Trebouxia sp. C0005]